jgi:hypothetical protein
VSGQANWFGRDTPDPGTAYFERFREIVVAQANSSLLADRFVAVGQTTVVPRSTTAVAIGRLEPHDRRIPRPGTVGTVGTVAATGRTGALRVVLTRT